ncbi:sensor histidine kinase [Thermomonospora umbrina]|uniref:histidine kinase n=1 Tax=Thermomonospora umbrina TaxID=111806 RepID=A0A3D9SRE6_9ACTN|nr:histidine kinase [Thermomonospora umbrina]REE96523.1 signal transduction histidine kinase [Thermomonospora umbrina]
MDATPPLPLVKRLPPGVWTALAWFGSLTYSILVNLTWPGEVEGFRPYRIGDVIHPSHWSFLVTATASAVAGSVLMRRRPLPALGLLLAASVFAAMALTSTEIAFPHFLAAEVALCQIAATASRRTSVAAAAMALGTLAAYAAVRLLLGFYIGTSTGLAVGLTAVIAWLVGNSLRQSRDHARTLQSQAITAERLRIARELHDMVAHSIGIIAIQAGAAKMVIDTRPAEAREALGVIENAGRETLSGLRRMLGALRRAEDTPVPTAPAPGLADVERLAETTTAAGVRVDVRWRGPRSPLPPEIDLSAFRIIQEAVTNVVRHADTPRCRVSIEHRDEELAIEVVDAGRGGRTTSGGGYGITGMRERVGLLHGEFSAGPHPEGGFRVAARLPVPAVPR